MSMPFWVMDRNVRTPLSRVRAALTEIPADPPGRERSPAFRHTVEDEMIGTSIRREVGYPWMKGFPGFCLF